VALFAVSHRLSTVRTGKILQQEREPSEPPLEALDLSVFTRVNNKDGEPWISIDQGSVRCKKHIKYVSILLFWGIWWYRSSERERERERETVEYVVDIYVLIDRKQVGQCDPGTK
jgi:hypothetical protein